MVLLIPEKMPRLYLACLLFCMIGKLRLELLQNQIKGASIVDLKLILALVNSSVLIFKILRVLRFKLLSLLKHAKSGLIRYKRAKFTISLKDMSDKLILVLLQLKMIFPSHSVMEHKFRSALMMATLKL